jgi:tetratricopeptide (TPR) repeat protein
LTTLKSKLYGITILLFLCATTASAQDLPPPRLEGLGVKEEPNVSDKKLPVLAEPELQKLSDNEKQKINSIVDTIFESEDEDKAEAGGEATINIAQDADGQVEVSVEKEVIKAEPITEKSILDSKEEIASRDEEEKLNKVVENLKEDIEGENTATEDKKVSKVFNTESLFREKTQTGDDSSASNYESENELNASSRFFDRRYNSYTNTPYIVDMKINPKPYYDITSEGVDFSPTRRVENSFVISSDQTFDNSFNDESPYQSLERIRALTKNNNKIVVKNDIEINRGTFKNPFYEEVETSGLSEEEMLPDEIDLEELDLSDGDSPLDISNLKPKKAAKTKSKPKPKFHFRDKDLIVEIKKPSKNLSKLYKAAREALSIGQYESAVTYFKEILEENPRNKKVLFGLATSYHKSKQLDKAKKTYLEVIKIDKDYLPAINNYIILVSNNLNGDSLSKLEEIWMKNPDMASIPAQIGNLYFEKGNNLKAAEYYGKAVNLDRGNYNYYYNLAIILEKLGDTSSAAKVYKKILDSKIGDDQLPEERVSLQKRYLEIISKR